MAFTYAYSLDNTSGAPIAKDFTVSGYTPKLGDTVTYSAGNVTGQAAAGTTTVLGVVAGSNFLGLATGGTYAATNSSTYNPSTLAKVIIDPNAVYRVPLKGGVAAPTVGTAYSLSVVSGDQQLDTGTTGAGGSIYKVIAYDAGASNGVANSAGNAFVVITSRTLA